MISEIRSPRWLHVPSSASTEPISVLVREAVAMGIDVSVAALISREIRPNETLLALAAEADLPSTCTPTTLNPAVLALGDLPPTGRVLQPAYVAASHCVSLSLQTEHRQRGRREGGRGRSV